MFCKKCGQENISGKFCKKCGNPISINNEGNKGDGAERASKPSPRRVRNNQASSIRPERRQKASNKGVLIAIAIVAAAAAIVCAVFFNEIRGNYYLKKVNEPNIRQEQKLVYSKNAVKSLNNAATRSVFENVMLENVTDNTALVDESLKEVKEVISQDEYKALALNIKNKELNSLCEKEKFKEATPILGELQELGEEFKENNNYSKIMTFNINNCTGSTISPSRLDTVMNTSDSKIVKGNFDDDSFEEIIQFEKKAASGDGEISINLFKYVDGEYTLVNNYIMVNSSYASLNAAEVYNYNKDKPAVYFKYRNMDESKYVSVITIENNAIKIKNTVQWDKSAYIRDIDNDGRYEIGSSSTYSNNAEVWYKLNEDGTTAVIQSSVPVQKEEPKEEKDESKTEVKTIIIDNSSNASNYNKSSEYIFANSNSRYLTSSDLSGLTKYQLSLARNEIFARHGYVFKLDEYKAYFNSKSWYRPNPYYVDNVDNLNVYEKANIEFIQKWEDN